MGTPGRPTSPSSASATLQALEPLEDALKLMKKGVSQREAAKQAGVSPETLRRFQKPNTTSRQEGRRWIILDTRPVSVVMATRGKMRDVTVSARREQRHQPPLDRDQPVPGDQRSVASRGLRRQGTAGQRAARSIRSRPAQMSFASSIVSANSRSSTSIARRCS